MPAMSDIVKDIAATMKHQSDRIRRLEKLVTRRRITICRVYNDANIAHVNSGKWQALTFNSERSDVGGMHSTTTNTSRLTAPYDGWYHIFGHIEFAANITGQRGIAISVNSTYIAENLYNAAATGAGGVIMPISISTCYYLSADQYVELEAYQNSGGNLNILASNNYSPEFGAVLLLDRP